MTIKLLKTDEGCTLFLEGRLDSVTSPEAEEYFGLTAGKYDNITLDLSKIEYVSSAGLGVLKTLHINMKEKGGNLYFRNTRKNVYEVFELTGFVGLFQFL